MAWFLRSKQNIQDNVQREMPDGLWTKCPSCSEIIFKKELEDYLAKGILIATGSWFISGKKWLHSRILQEYRKDPNTFRFSFWRSLQTAFKLPPERALEWLKQRGKNLKVSTNWDEMNSVAHDNAFTVSKVMSANLLQDIYNHVEKAKSEGWN